MILLAALVGAVAGAAAIFAMFHTQMLQERSGAAVFLAAVALFYPVFAAAENDVPGLILHSAIFVAFSWLAIRGFRRGLHLIAGGLIAHGLFDAGLMSIGTPGPIWWPAFCATVDITAGAALIRLIQTQKVPR